MDAYKDAAKKFIAGHTLTVEERGALATGLLIHTLDPEEVVEAVLLGLKDPSPSARITVIKLAEALKDLDPQIQLKLEAMMGDDSPTRDSHPGVREAARAFLANTSVGVG